ncbi:coiled-coil domain-containing protein 103 [Clonorchis sinensis]|uniref:Coiled-coil domain-containing protein 103 n=1 Tax=Clonorchis sinensis TaxID=79923 RepID=G7YRT3_CLOSI|nr:coiled-coil domain-containing protein 103 [Clonorchis sinensis]
MGTSKPDLVLRSVFSTVEQESGDAKSANNVGHLRRLGISVDRLESELNSAVAKDARYWLENDTKIRAVEQGVPTYEHFRQLVAGCHLRPLDKSELTSFSQAKSSWNHVRAGCPVVASPEKNFCDITSSQEPITPQKFYSHWHTIRRKKHSSDKEHLHDLAEFLLSQDSLLHRALFDSGLGVSMLSEFLAVLEYASQLDTMQLSSVNSRTEILSGIVSALNAFSASDQFPIAVDFLSEDEKSSVRQLLDRIAAREPVTLSSRVEELKPHLHL